MTATRRGVRSALNLLSRGGEHAAAMGHTHALRAETEHESAPPVSPDGMAG
jgi:hypothetical protein